MIKYVVDRIIVNFFFIVGESLMICYEFFCYFSMFFFYVNFKGGGGLM